MKFTAQQLAALHPHPWDLVPPKTRGRRVYRRAGVAVRLFRRVEPDERGCWLWQGSRCPSTGYGCIRNDDRTDGTHRVSWLLHRGAIPDGLSVLHRCDVRTCVNPEHLFLGTHTDNMQDMVAKGRSSSTVHPERLPRGRRHHQAKLTEEQVVEIRRLADDGTPLLQLAKRFGVSDTLVGGIVRRRWWRHVGDAT